MSAAVRDVFTPRTAQSGAVGRDELEVATLVADTLRASMRVTGPLTPRAVPLLSSVLATHLSAGRRYLRVDLAPARLDDAVLHLLVRAQRTVRETGGMLVFENAGPALIDAVRRAQLSAAR